jgi:hypothetical protein
MATPAAQAATNPIWWRTPRNRGRATGPEAARADLFTLECLSQLALEEDRDGRLAEVDGQLLVGLQEPVHEFVGTHYEGTLPRPDMGKQRLDQLGIAAQQQRLQPLVELPLSRRPETDTRDERPAGRPRKEDENLTADQREQRLERRLVAEPDRALALAAAEKPA